jgi:pilus assembly protein CpaF
VNRAVKSEDVIRFAAPFDPILADDSVWEIMVDSYERVLVSRGGGVEQVVSPFSSAQELRALIDGLFGLYGIELGPENPVGYLRLPDHSRVMAVVPPNAVNGPHLVLRRIVGPRLDWNRLIELGFLPQGAYDLLKGAVEARANILVSGGTGAGKTTAANLIAELSPSDERVIVVEQVYEMQVKHPRVLRLEAGGPSGLTFEDVLTAATRMRPDRLIVGEIDGPVAASVLQHFGSGYDGSITMIHATSVENALNRLESFCLMANLGLGLAEIRLLIAAGIHLITYQEHMPTGRRKMVEIVELCGIEDHRYVLQPLMRYNRETEQFDFTGIQPSWRGKPIRSQP